MAYVVAAGATLSVGGAVGNLVSCSGDINSALIDVTHLGSTKREFIANPIPGLHKFSCECKYDPASAGVVAAKAAAAASTVAACVLTLSDTSTATFSAFVETFSVNVNGVDDVVTASISLQVDGAVVWA